MDTVVKCKQCLVDYNTSEDDYIYDDERCGKCHVTDHMLKAFDKGIEVNGVLMCGKEVKKE